MSLFNKNLQELKHVLDKLQNLDEDVQFIGHLAAQTLRRGGKIFFCGNGGSAADSQHLAAELTGRFIADRKPLSGIALTTDTSALTCIGNDYSFDEIFARQLVGLGRKEDMLVGISTSGNSRNVIRAVEEANKLGMVTVGLLGRDGGKLRTLCNHSILVDSKVTARIQECHILIGHTICGIIELELELL